MIKDLIKQGFRIAGLHVEWRDRLEETIPPGFNRSPFLPRVYRGVLHKYLFYLKQIERVKNLEGDIVECGVSIGHGALVLLLLSEYVGVERMYYGFDSFAGFPDPAKQDRTTPITGKDYWASPPETVLKVLREGRLSDEKIRKQVRLVKGMFEETLAGYDGRIALLHLDCDLYDSYKTALTQLYPKVVKGGIIMFDEYDDPRWPGAKVAIDEFFADKPEKPVTHNRCSWKYYVEKQ